MRPREPSQEPAREPSAESPPEPHGESSPQGAAERVEEALDSAPLPAGSTSPPLPRALIERCLDGPIRLGLRRPRVAAWGALLAIILSVLLGARIRLRTDATDLLPEASSRAFEVLQRLFGSADSFWVLLGAPSPAPERLERFAQELLGRLRPSPLVRRARSGWTELLLAIRKEALPATAPLLAPSSSLPALERLLSPEGMREALEKRMLDLGLPGLGSAEPWAFADPLETRRFLDARLGSLDLGLRTREGSPLFLSPAGDRLLVQVEGTFPLSDLERVKELRAALEQAISGAREALEQAAPSSAGPGPGAEAITAGLAGGYAYAFESEASLRSDLQSSIIASFLLVGAILLLALRSWRLLPGLLAPLVVGGATAFGLFAGLRGEVVSLSLVAGAILIGLGIDNVVHLVLRILELPARSSREEAALAARAVGRPMLFAAVTTAGAFLTFPLVGERFLTDLGLLSAIGILTTMGAALLLVPSWLVSARARAEARGRKLRAASMGSERLAALVTRRPALLLTLAAVPALVGLGSLLVSPPRLETDLRSLHVTGSEALATSDSIAEAFGGGSDGVVILVEADLAGASAASEALARPPGARPAAPSRDMLEGEAVAAVGRLDEGLARLQAEGWVSGWVSPSRFLPSAREWEQTRSVLASARPERRLADLEGALEEVGFDPQALRGSMEQLGMALSRATPPGMGDLRALGLGGELDRLVQVDGETGYALCLVQPSPRARFGPGQRELLERLDAAIAAAGVRAQVTGSSAVSHGSMLQVVHAFLDVSVLALSAVVALVLVLFRSVRLTLLALLPVTLGLGWAALLAKPLGLGVSFMSLGLLPMLLGTGVDYGIHLVQRWAETPRPSARVTLGAAAPAILLTGLTTLAGFGSLAMASHRGLASVGMLAALGIASTLFAALGPLPAALALLERRRAIGRFLLARRRGA